MSEYIPRLREELVEAAARERAGQRHLRVRPRRLALIAAVGAIAAAAVFGVMAIDLPNDERPVGPVPPSQGLAYRVTPADRAAAAASVLRARIAAAGIAGATVSVNGDRIGVDAAPADRARVAALSVPGALAIYDWETSVLGGEAPVSKYEAVRRAAKAPPTQGPRAYWLVDNAAREVLAGPGPTPGAVLGTQMVPAGTRVLAVPGGARLVHDTHGWYALAGDAALGNADVATARATPDPTGRGGVTLDLTPTGLAGFRALTREVARQGAADATPGENPVFGSHHIAIVLDDELAALPYVNFQEAPDGIDGSDGLPIEGDLTTERARDITAILATGPMPADLEPVAG